jgi:hypothetical protein
MPLLQLLNQSGITTAGLTATGRVYAMDFDKGPFMGASLGVATASYVWEQEVAWTGGVNVGAKYTFDPPLFLDVAFGYQLMLIDWENYGGLGLTLGGGWAF